MNNNFKPANCKKCGAVVWQGISWAGFEKKLDTKSLGIAEELEKRIAGIMTFECHRYRDSFEAVERSLIRIRGERKSHVIILAEHICGAYRLFETEVPNYWSVEKSAQ